MVVALHGRGFLPFVQWCCGFAFLALSTGAFITPCLAVAPGETIRIPFIAKPGDKFKVRITKTNQLLEKGKEVRAISTTQIYDGEVVALTGTGYRIKWVMQVFQSPASGADGTTRVFKLMQGLPIEYETDLKGRPVRIPGWKAVIARVIEAIGAQETANRAEARIWKQVAAVFKRHTPESAAIFLLQEAALIAHVQNFALPLNQAVSTKQTVANPLGGPRIVQNSTMALTRYDETTGQAEIEWTSFFDPKSTKRSVVEGFRVLARRMGRSPTALDATSRDFILTRTDRFKATVGIKDGWARRVFMTRHIASGTKSDLKERHETWRIVIGRKASNVQTGPTPSKDTDKAAAVRSGPPAPAEIEKRVTEPELLVRKPATPKTLSQEPVSAAPDAKADPGPATPPVDPDLLDPPVPENAGKPREPLADPGTPAVSQGPATPGDETTSNLSSDKPAPVKTQADMPAAIKLKPSISEPGDDEPPSSNTSGW